ncbi:lasso peptide biosynthesis PqqD family chaperone [Nonomuraea sp. NPDC050451]|uniref:lasso peptide biosynthesis PqqD family chaperone n=1 Tax=Nonomuraea sp. NPDC050451 TaxID=3364364 RepID=UPI0037AB3BB2
MFALHDDVSHATTDYGIVLLDERSGQYFHLDATSGLIIDLLNAGLGVDAAVRNLTDRFDVDQDRARNDILALIKSLGEKGLLKS